MSTPRREKMIDDNRPSARDYLLFPAALALALLWRAAFPLVDLIDLAFGYG